MSDKVLKFCKAYETKVVNDKKIKEIESKGDVIETHMIAGHIDRINFKVSYSSQSPICFMFGTPNMNTINLDKEDLDYLYKKYSKKLQEERADRIAKVEAEYKI